MSSPIKRFLRKLPFYKLMHKAFRSIIPDHEMREWLKQGKPDPPPHQVKQRNVAESAKRHGIKILVETGTFEGGMIDAMKSRFKFLYSIELSQELFQRAQNRFGNSENILLIQGDSATEIPNVLSKLNGPALFWLDGHYSGGITAKGLKSTPVMEELESILAHSEKRHVILIDDARVFGNDPAYPTIDELKSFVRSRRPETRITIQDDCIFIEPEDE